jgi:predicted dehydrogenase
METLRVGVIGLGRMGQRHCRVYSNLRRAHLAGVFDVSRQVALRTARQYDVPYFADLDELLGSVDAVSLATPTPTHLELGARCLKRGVHVLVEKPLAETAEQAEQLARLAEGSGLRMQVGHIERFNPAYTELKNVLEGNIVLAINVRRLSAYESSNADVDVILDLMIHDFDLVLNLLGQEPNDVTALGLSAHGHSVDHAVVHMNYDTGPLVSLTASRVTEQKVRSIEVTLADAYVECDLLNKTIEVHRSTIGEYLNHNPEGVKYRQESVVERLHVPAFEPLFLELQSFVDSIVDNKPTAVSGQDGVAAMRVADAARRAMSLRCVDLRLERSGNLAAALPVMASH